MAEADRLGVSFFVIAGGEPLIRPEILDIARDFPRNIFLLDEEKIERLKRQANTIPVLSLEGMKSQTDKRRGEGVYDQLRVRMEELKKAGFSSAFPSRSPVRTLAL